MIEGINLIKRANELNQSYYKLKEVTQRVLAIAIEQAQDIEKQTGQNQVFKGDELKKIELKNFEPVNVVKILYPFEIIEIGDHNLDKKIFNFLKSKFYKKCDCVDGKK